MSTGSSFYQLPMEITQTMFDHGHLSKWIWFALKNNIHGMGQMVTSSGLLEEPPIDMFFQEASNKLLTYYNQKQYITTNKNI